MPATIIINIRETVVLKETRGWTLRGNHILQVANTAIVKKPT